MAAPGPDAAAAQRMLLSWSMIAARPPRACVELRHRPGPAGTSPYFPQETPAAAARGPGPHQPRCYCASVQGARPHNEDAFTARGTLFAVHDGHGGREAVDRLLKFLLLAPVPGDARGLADMYAAAAGELGGETSGVVSACVLQAGGRTHLAWVGDCTAAVFSPGTGRVCAADLTRIDDAAGGEPSAEAGASFATEPHALSPAVRAWARSQPEQGGVTGVPRAFVDARSQHEYRALCRASGRELEVHVVAWLPFAPQGLSARIAGSIEPTRALGDAKQSGTVVRGAEVISASGLPPRCFAALASDGLLDGGAFQDTESLCMFLSDPLAFVRQRFYGPWQNLTYLLVAGGHLPCVEPRPDELGRHALYAAWKRCRDWDGVRLLLRAHLEAAGRLRPQGSWHAACAASVRWMCEKLPEDGCDGGVLRSPTRAVYAAAHMAVIMGSHDNVTVMAVRMT